MVDLAGVGLRLGLLRSWSDPSDRRTRLVTSSYTSVMPGVARLSGSVVVVADIAALRRRTSPSWTTAIQSAGPARAEVEHSERPSTLTAPQRRCGSPQNVAVIRKGIEELTPPSPRQ